MKKQPAYQKVKRDKTTIVLAVTVVVLFSVVFIYGSVNLYNKREALRVQAEGLQEKVDEETQRTEDLKVYETYTHTKKFAEETAKEVLGYVYDDEIVYKLNR